MDNLTMTIFHAHYNTRNSTLLQSMTQVPDYVKSDKEILVNLFLEGYAMTAVGLFGLIGNLLSAWILSRPRMRALPINCLFLGLAFGDTLLIVTFGCGVGVPAICSYYGVDFSRMKAVIQTLPAAYAIVFTAHSTSVYCILTITLERYWAVCHPMRRTVLDSGRRSFYACLGVLAVSVLINLPRWWEFTCNSRRDNVTNTTDMVYLPVTTELRKNPHYEKFIFALYGLVNFLIPILAIACLNFCIFKSLRRANSFRKSSLAALPPPTVIDENSLSVILLVIVLVFLICNSVFLVNIIASFFKGGQTSVFVIDQLRNFLWTFNSSVNFAIYYAYSENFRDVFLQEWRSFKQNLKLPFCK